MNDHHEDAARWFAASRRGVMLHDERQAFDAWRAVPANAARLAELQGIWNEIGPVALIEPSVAVAAPSTGHRRQLAAVMGIMLLVAGILPRVDNGWWNALDWWSR